MPTYEYLCDKCGVEFEREQRISDDPIRTCPECGARRVKRLISNTSFVLKGGGWYSDLYASGKPAGSGSTEASNAKPTESGSGPSDSGDSSDSKKSDKADKGAKPDKKAAGKGKGSSGTKAAA